MNRSVRGGGVAGLFLLLTLAGGSWAKDGASQYLKMPSAWYAGAEARQIASNILSWQSELGGWPKNTNTTAGLFQGNRKELKPTFDNDATTDELRFLARVYDATREARCRQACERGFDYILAAQYPTGGWPQFYPPGPKYHRHITFNDDAMVRLLEFLRETTRSGPYGFLGAQRKKAATDAFERGVQCILKCQIKVKGRLTVWCAQHDEKDYSPQGGRTFELASLSGAESVGIVRLLMSLEKPSPEVIRAIEGAVAWFQTAKINGLRVEVTADPLGPRGKNKIVVPDVSAPPLWARFYDISSNQPIFVDRDGIARSSLAEIGYERRNGYSWYGSWPQRLLERDYPAWKKKPGSG